MADTSASFAAPSPPEAFTPRAAFHGRTVEAWGLVLGVLLLKIVTLGIYHFWGRTRIRRYLWSQTAWEGERLVYTGTGKELLLGYLRAFVLVIVPIYAIVYVIAWLSGTHPMMGAVVGPVGYLVILYLTGVALYSSWRYRLGRTLWRGIRFGLAGSAFSYGSYFLVQSLLVPCTLGLYMPYMQCNVVRRVVAEARFGTEPFVYSGRGKDLLHVFLRTIGMSVILWIIAMATTVAVPLLAAGVRRTGAPWLGLVPVVVMVPVAIAFAALWIAYQGAALRYHVEHTRLGPLQFRLAFRWLEYLRLALGNLALLGLTLGIGLPITAMRTARFVTARLGTAGALDYGTIAQSQVPLSRTGEGLTQALDLGSL